MALVRWGDRNRFGSDDWRVQSCGALGEGSFSRRSLSLFFFSFFFCLIFTLGSPQDCIVVSISPPDSHRGPIGDMRCVIPIRLVTDPAWDEGTMSPDVFVFQGIPTPTPSEAHGSALATSAGVAGAEEDAPEYTRDSYVTLENA